MATYTDIKATKDVLNAQGGIVNSLVFMHDGEQEVFFGMTMREHYAGLAMAALIQGYSVTHHPSNIAAADLAKEAVAYADHMIAVLRG